VAVDKELNEGPLVADGGQTDSGVGLRRAEQRWCKYD